MAYGGRRCDVGEWLGDIIDVSDADAEETVTDAQAELIRLAMISEDSNVELALDVLRKLESK